MKLRHNRDPHRRLFTRGSWPETSRVSEILRKETVGGVLLLLAAAAAMVWANSPAAHSYTELAEFAVGPQGWHLKLSLSAWAADGLLAIFFFVVGLELKREFVAGDLRDPARAALPIAAAVGGMVVPSAIYVGVNLATGHPENLRGWAVPIATDIAFALAVLAVISTHLPSSLRTFLLTLAVVDDLLAIIVIAVFYTDHLNPAALALAVIPGCVVRGGRAARRAAVVAADSVGGGNLGVGACQRCARDGGRGAARLRGAGAGRDTRSAETFEHALRPLSAGIAVPVFAFFAAGVSLGGWAGLTSTLGHPVTVGVLAGLVLGKPIGVFGTTFLLARFTGAELDEDLGWLDVLGVAMLAGVGFTVSLLIGGLAFGLGTLSEADAKIGVLIGSVVAGLLAALVLLSRNARYRRIHQRETVDADNDGVPDIYQP